MKQYKIIALSVSGKGKQLFKAGDIVSADHFEEKSIPALINGKFIEENGDVEETESLLQAAKINTGKNKNK